MKTGIHPAYGETTVVCGCGNSFTTRSTKESGHIVVEVCSQCHPFYTGKQKILDSGGRVARFEKRYGKRAESKQSAEADAAPADSSPTPTSSVTRPARGRASTACSDPEGERTAP
jgi:large subunit ribosomal protein L31